MSVLASSRTVLVSERSICKYDGCGEEDGSGLCSSFS